jgi:hypothetical protein
MGQVELPCTAEEYFSLCLGDDSKLMQSYCDHQKSTKLQANTSQKLCCAAGSMSCSEQILLGWKKRTSIPNNEITAVVP